MEVILSVTYVCLFIFLIQKLSFFEIVGISKKQLIHLFLLKITAGIILWAIYTFYYTDRSTSDIYKYFDDSKIMFDAIHAKPIHFIKMFLGIGNNTNEFLAYYQEMNFWEKKSFDGFFNNNHLIIRFNAFFRFFSLGYFKVHIIFMCFISFIGLTAIYKSFIPFLRDKKKELTAIVFLLPSVIFWGSGVLKEGIILFSLGLSFYYFQNKLTFKTILLSGFMLLLLMTAKFYVFISILPSLLFMRMMKRDKESKLFLKFGILISVFTALSLNIHHFTGIQNPLVSLVQKQNAFNTLAKGNYNDAKSTPLPVPNSAIKINHLEPNLKSFLKNSPQALINSLFRPFLWEIKSPIMLLPAIENIILLCFFFICLYFIKPLSQIPWKYVLICLSFSLILFLIIGTTTSILGAITRYRVPGLPFLLIGFLFLLDKNKIMNSIPFYKKLFK